MHLADYGVYTAIYVTIKGAVYFYTTLKHI